MLRNTLRTLTDPPATTDAYTRRLLRRVLWVFTTGVACCFAALVLLFAWVATGNIVLWTAVKYLTGAETAHLVIMGVLMVLLYRHRPRKYPG